MGDIEISTANTNSKELYCQGVRAYVLQDYQAAVQALSKSSELMTIEHQTETHDSLGDVYLYYGKSLLELYRKDSNPLWDGVLKTVNEGSDSEEIESDDESKQNGEEEVSEQKEAEVSSTERPEENGSEESKPQEEVVGSSTAENKEAEEEEEDFTDLQVAWEVLELAKSIFKARGTPGQKSLAETLINLGEVSLESGNFTSAIEDMTEGLNLQKSLYGNDSRIIAESYYKLGFAFSTNAQIDEAIESFCSANEYLETRISNLNVDKENAENREEIEEIKAFIPEIQEKIADMKNLKIEIAKQVSSGESKPANGNTSEASSSKQATDISHLVKRKRKPEEEDGEKPSAKKPSP